LFDITSEMFYTRSALLDKETANIVT